MKQGLYAQVAALEEHTDTEGKYMSSFENLSNDQEHARAQQVRNDRKVGDILAGFRTAICGENLDSTMEAVMSDFVDRYVQDGNFSLLEAFHGKVCLTCPTSFVAEKSAFALFAHYTKSESPNYEKAEGVLKELLNRLDSRNLPLVSKLYRYLAKLYTLQRIKLKKQALDKYEYLGCVDEFHRPKLISLSKILIAFINLESYKSLCDKMNCLSSEIEGKELDSDVATCLYYIGKFHVAMRSFDEAEKCFDKILHSLLESRGDSLLVGKVLLRLGRVYEKEGRTREAEKLYTTFVSRTAATSSARMYVRLGDLHFAQHASIDQYDKALSILKSTGASIEDIALVILRQAVILNLVGEYEKLHSALSQARELLDSSPQSQKVTSLQITLKSILKQFPEQTFYEIEYKLRASDKQQCILEKRSGEASEYYLSALQIFITHPGQSSTIVKIAEHRLSHIPSYEFCKSVNKFIETALQYIPADSPEHADIITHAASYCHYVSWSESYDTIYFVQTAYNVIKKHPSKITSINKVFTMLKSLYIENELFAEEEKLLLEHLELFPESGTHWTDLCMFYKIHGRSEDEEEAYRRAVESLRRAKCTGPSLLILFALWGSFCFRMKKTIKAEECFLNATSAVVTLCTADFEKELAPCSFDKTTITEALKSTVQFFVSQNQCREIESSLQKVAAKAKVENYPMMLKIALMHLGDMHYAQESYEKAKMYYRELVIQSSYCDIAILKLIKATGDTPETIELKAAIKNNHFDRYVKVAEVHIHYGRCCEAKASLKRALLMLVRPLFFFNQSIPKQELDKRNEEYSFDHYPLILEQLSSYFQIYPNLNKLWLQLSSDIPQQLDFDRHLGGVIWQRGLKRVVLHVASELTDFYHAEVPDVYGKSLKNAKAELLQFIAAEHSKIRKADGYAAIANVYSDHGRYYSAKVYFKKAIRLYKSMNPTSSKTVLTIQSFAALYISYNRIGKALSLQTDLLQTITKINPRHSRIGKVAIELANLYRSLKQFEKTEELLKLAVGTKTENKTLILQTIAFIELCKLYIETGRGAEAEKWVFMYMKWFYYHDFAFQNSEAIHILEKLKKFSKAEMLLLKCQWAGNPVLVRSMYV